MEKGTNRRIESKADGHSDGNRKSKHQIQKEVLLVLTVFFVQLYQRMCVFVVSGGRQSKAQSEAFQLFSRSALL